MRAAPCPNCGRITAVFCEYEPPPIPLRTCDYRVCCVDCYEPGHILVHGETEQQAIEAWNEAVTNWHDMREEASRR